MTALFFESLKFRKKTPETLRKICEDLFLEIAWKKILITFFFWRTLALVPLVLGLGLEHICPWPREGLSSEGLSLALDFFCVLGLGLEPCVLDYTSGDYDFTGRTPESGLSLKCVICIVYFTLNCRTLVMLWLGMKISFRNRQLRYASTELKSLLRKLRCASENMIFKARLLFCAFNGLNSRCVLLRCAFCKTLLVPASGK